MTSQQMLILADILNCEYQAGGDSNTLANVAHAFSAAFDLSDDDRHAFENVASMGGLELSR